MKLKPGRMKRTWMLLVVSLVLSTAVVAVLFILSDNLVHARNPFIRQFPPHAVTLSASVDIDGVEKYYVSGITNHTVFLSSTRLPLKLKMLRIDRLSDSSSITLSVRNENRVKFWKVKVSVDSPYFYISDGTAPAVFQGRFGQNATQLLYASAFHSTILPLTTRSFVIKSLMSSSREYALGKQSANEPHVRLFPALLEKQVDGRFCVDGTLDFNKTKNRIVYTYFYRNEFMVMDTSMNLLLRANTIDTVSRAKIEVASIAAENTVTMVAPPMQVNRRSATSGKWLFVNSSLLSKNESQEAFENASVIDVYNLENGKYKLSFYIDDFDDQKIQSFHVMGNKLIACFENHLRVYDMMPEYFSD